MNVGRLRNGFVALDMAVDAQEAGLSGIWLCFIIVCFVLGAGAGFLEAEVVVRGFDVYTRCGSVRLC